MHRLRHALITVTALIIASCGGGSGGDGNGSELAVRVLHASPDAPLINVLIDGSLLRSAIDYASGTPFVSLTARSYDIAVDTIVPSGTERVIDLQDQPLEGGIEYSVVALGLAAADDVQALVIQNPIEGIESGFFRVQLVHGVPGNGPVDVYLTPVSQDLNEVTPNATLTFRENSPRITLPAGNWQVRITPIADKTTLLFDSGETPFGTNEDLLVVAVPNTGTGTAPITVLLNNGFASQRLLDVSSQAEIRVLQLSGDAPPLAVTADPTNDDPVVNLTTDFPTGVPFPESTAYTNLEASEYKFIFVDPAVPAVEIMSRTQSILRNQKLTLAAVGLLTTIAPVMLLDDVRSVATEGRLRVINGSQAEGVIDIYATTPGTDLNSATPIARGVGLGTATSFLSVNPADYQISITEPNLKTVVATASVSLTAGSAYTAIVRDNFGGGLPLAVEIENSLP